MTRIQSAGRPSASNSAQNQSEDGQVHQPERPRTASGGTARGMQKAHRLYARCTHIPTGAQVFGTPTGTHQLAGMQ